jgi:hypothetical protein
MHCGTRVRTEVQRAQEGGNTANMGASKLHKTANLRYRIPRVREYWTEKVICETCGHGHR